jgi:DNA-binding GntR family transcriptional regulator
MAQGPAKPRAELVIAKHDRVYQSLRRRVLTGAFLPGKPITLRGIASQLNVSVQPAREALRRLIAERALEMQDNRRVRVPAMSPSKFEQIIFARTQLETELARRALPNVDVGALRDINTRMEAAAARGDIEAYMLGNLDFHFAIYQKSGAELLLGLTESVWLQFAPFMRLAYGRSGTFELKNEHLEICRSIEASKKSDLTAAITADIVHGMRITGELALAGRADQAACPVERASRRKRRAD